EKEAAKAPPLMTLWNVATREMIGRIESPAKANEREAFGLRGGGITLSPDGRLVAYAQAGARANPVRAEATSSITVWDVATRKPRHGIEVKAATASSLAFSPDSRRLAVVARSGPVFGGDSAAFVQVF